MKDPSSEYPSNKLHSYKDMGVPSVDRGHWISPQVAQITDSY